MRKLIYRPEVSGYRMKPTEDVLSVNVVGGHSRKRLDAINSTSTVNVTWLLGTEGYDYIMAFYRSVAKKSTAVFLIDLIVDSSTLQEYTVSFVPGSFGLTGVKGLSHTVTAQLEVHPRPVDTAADLALVDAASGTGGSFG